MLESLDGVLLDVTTVPGLPGTIVVLVHGIAADKEQGGMYTELAQRLAELGRASLRFSFRGHGASGGASSSILIANEISDLYAVVRHCIAAGHRLSFVASSFGAVSTLAVVAHASLPLDRLVLWKPVLSLDDTFLHPSLPWGRSLFGEARIGQAWEQGFLALDGLRLSPVLFQEMTRYDPLADLLGLRIPWLAVHGSADRYVSFDIARSAASRSQHGSLYEITGADHRFERAHERDAAITVTLDFLLSG